MPERVTFETPDGVKIVGDWVTAPTTIGAAILVHMMPATRSSWAGLQQALAKRNIASLAIDLRGHGDSTEVDDGSTADYHAFGDDEHRSSLLDVESAYDWLRSRGFTPRQVVVGGASFGANLAVQLLTEFPDLAGGVLLSAGTDYHGLNAVEEAPSILPDQSVWAAASEGDDQESFEATTQVVELATSDRKQFVPLRQAGHGTGILITHPEIVDQMAEAVLASIQRG